MISQPEQTCLIIGAGHAGATLALQVRKEGWQGRIVLISAEHHLPYHRPPLSKAVLAGDKTIEGVALRPRSMYESSGIELHLGERVEAVLPAEKMLRMESGEMLLYDRLALCTGARVLRLPLGEHLQHVFYLRSADDASAIRAAAKAGGRAVIIGGGYIGLEAAAVLNTFGLQVTVLERTDRILQRVTSEPVSEYFAKLHRDRGVEIITGAEVTAISGERYVDSVQCADGSRHAADLVIIGIGVLPETRLAEAAGLRIDNGIVVNGFAQTSDPHIFAAGDCTSHPCQFYGRQLRLESVQNANDQARAAAAGICDRPVLYDSLPWFWSEQYDTRLQSAGLSGGFDSLQLVGDPQNENAFCVLYGREGILIAADCVNRPKDYLLLKKLIEDRSPLGQIRL
jgi:3-phenylpropionate/trans-cinnamate dioxygenase ferredoxin reductase component